MESLTYRPNVLIFCVDEMRADHLACAGNPLIRTPNLDALASRGTRFTRAYCNHPICMPARATMFTGLLPRDHGVRTNGISLRADLVTLPQMLASAGYRTHSAGKLHLTPWVPKVDPPLTARYPECLEYWTNGLIQKFPEPYFGFQTVDFVGGHGGWVFGDYLAWLHARGGTREMLGPQLDGPVGTDAGGRSSIKPELHYNRFIADSTIRFIESSVREEAPFVAWCSFPDPHPPLDPPAPYATMYDASKVPLPHARDGEIHDLPPFYQQILDGRLRVAGCDNSTVRPQQVREMLARIYGMITHLDDEIGRVLHALERAGVRDDTLVIFTSDHGDMIGDHGLMVQSVYTFRGAMQVPLIVALPDAANRARVCDVPVSHLDLMPSILEICRVAPPGAKCAHDSPFPRGAVRPLQPLPGRSWRGLLNDSDSASDRPPVVIENDDPETGLHVRGLVTQSHRISIYAGTPDGELFDLDRDPWELHNLWYDDAQAPLRSRLTAQLLHAYAQLTPMCPVPPWNS